MSHGHDDVDGWSPLASDIERTHSMIKAATKSINNAWTKYEDYLNREAEATDDSELQALKKEFEAAVEHEHHLRLRLAKLEADLEKELNQHKKSSQPQPGKKAESIVLDLSRERKRAGVSRDRGSPLSWLVVDLAQTMALVISEMRPDISLQLRESD